MRNIPVFDRTPAGQELPPEPSDGSIVSVNPPAFIWLTYDKAAYYRVKIWNTKKKTKYWFSNLTNPVLVLSKVLESGHWAWQYYCLDNNLKVLGKSLVRHFTIPQNTPQLAMPDIKVLKTKLTALRPRLFLVKNRMKELQKHLKLPLWQEIANRAKESLNVPLPSEPEPFTKNEWNVTDWRRISTVAKTASAIMLRFALVYAMTGNKVYLDKAKEWLFRICDWDPSGVTSHKICDEASMPILERISLTYDWIHDRLSYSEREKICKVVKQRGEEVYNLWEKINFIARPFSSHEGRVTGFMGLAGLSFSGEIPEADKWLEYVIKTLIASYPGWGKDDGGWSQGINYWSAYMCWLNTFVYALKQVTGINLANKPFYKNTGYFGIYFHPWYSKRFAFGDSGEGLRVKRIEKMLFNYLSNINNDPYLKWQADKIELHNEQDPNGLKWKEWFLEDVFSFLGLEKNRSSSKSVKPLPCYRYFSDIGWVAFHSQLEHGNKNVSLYFKSSYYGSFSHSHADQNSFILNAYGEPLVIDSGYYPWYGSPHDVLWTRQTRAHNCILVNKRGQSNFNWMAKGKIKKFLVNDPFYLICGEASQAYNLPMPKLVKDLSRKYLPNEKYGPKVKVEKFLRTIFFVKKNRIGPYLIIHDELKTNKPAEFDWLLHSLEPMKINKKENSVLLKNNKVRAWIKFIWPSKLKFRQTDKFVLPPEERCAGFPNQWHFSATTVSRSTTMDFFVLIVPYLQNSGKPQIEVSRVGPIANVKIGEDEIILNLTGDKHVTFKERKKNDF